MAKIKKGTYRFNDVLTKPSAEIEQAINFECRASVEENASLVADCYAVEILTDGVDMSLYMGYNTVKAVSGDEQAELDGANYFIPYKESAWIGLEQIVSNDHSSSMTLPPNSLGQTITILEDTDVSDEFGVWFTANATAVVEGKPISGKWTFKDVLDIPSGGVYQGVYQEVNFTLATKVMALGGVDVVCSCDRLNFVNPSDGDCYYYVVSSVPDLSSYGFACPFNVWCYNDGWNTDTYGEGIKIIDFGDTPQYVSEEFYSWLIENTVRSGIRNLAIMGQLIDKANAVTGKADATLADGVASLCEGYGQGGGATVVPLTVTENGVYDAPYYETATETWDSNTEYVGSVTVDGATLSFKKAEKLIVPDDLNELKNRRYMVECEYRLDGETQTEQTFVVEELGITEGIVATLQDFTVLWVKNAAPLNTQYGISFLEDNTVYVTNYAQLLAEAMIGGVYFKISVTAPSKKIENVAFCPVNVNLPTSEETKKFTIQAGATTYLSYDEYYRHFEIEGSPVQNLEITPTLEDKVYYPDEGHTFKQVFVKGVDVGDVSTLHQLCGIYLKGIPKTEYKIGEWLDVAMGELVCLYTDGSTQEILLQHEYIYGFTTENAGTIPLTIKYTENGITSQTMYYITVTE